MDLIGFEMQFQKFSDFFKGIVSVDSSDPPCTDDNVRFTMVPLKAFSDQV